MLTVDNLYVSTFAMRDSDARAVHPFPQHRTHLAEVHRCVEVSPDSVLLCATESLHCLVGSTVREVHSGPVVPV